MSAECDIGVWIEDAAGWSFTGFMYKDFKLPSEYKSVELIVWGSELNKIVGQLDWDKISKIELHTNLGEELTEWLKLKKLDVRLVNLP